ncbi:ROK family protein [Patescibacteria group bacterium]|nr:ROK family protein [Patescibacteria group bacterium]
MYILFDIGGTKMRIAGSKDLNNFSEPIVVDTPKNAEDGIQTLKRIIGDIAKGEPVTALAGGVPGSLNREKSKLTHSPHLGTWIDLDIKGELEKTFDSTVYLENDSALVGLGEAVAGAGKGYSIVAYITVSTGVGGARIVNGKIDNNVFGFEPGHQIIDMYGTVCPSCSEGEHQDGGGHLEGYVSGTSVERCFSKRAYEITDNAVWDELAKWLAYGLNNTIVHWSPNVVVLGGSMIVKEVGIKVANVSQHLHNILKIVPEIPELKQATLEDFGGLHGALALLKQHKSTNKEVA